MITCDNCFHFPVCSYVKENGNGRVLKNSPCFNFVDKSRVIYLPIKVTTELLEDLKEYCYNMCVDNL